MSELKPKKKRARNTGVNETKAKVRAKILQSLAKHPSISYRAVEVTRGWWKVAQFFEENQVAIVV